MSTTLSRAHGNHLRRSLRTALTFPACIASTAAAAAAAAAVVVLLLHTAHQCTDCGALIGAECRVPSTVCTVCLCCIPKCTNHKCIKLLTALYIL